MTEYGRSPGSEPWHPDDPLYGEQNWSGGYDGTGGQSAPGGGWQEGYDAQAQYPQAQYYPGQRAEQGGWDTGDPYYAQGQYPRQAQHPQQGGYGTGEFQQPYGTQEMYLQQDPYGQRHPQHPQQTQHPPPYQSQQSQQAQQAQYPQQTQAMPPQQMPPQGMPRQQSGPGQGPGGAAPGGPYDDLAGPDPETGWDPGPDQGERDFFSRDDDDDDADRDAPTRTGRRGDRPKKRRAGCGCVAIALVVVGGLGGVAWYGYGFYQDRFGAAPDYAGEGSGEIQIEIPEGSSVSAIGNILREAGVVRSHDAFVQAAGDDGQLIQAGIYTLREQMSAESAVALLLDPASSAANTLTIPEGERASDIYALIDAQLGLDEGATAEVAETADIGLPEWAEGDPEGFLFPARYDVGEETTPEQLLTRMVDRAEDEFAEIDLEGQAAELDRTPREILIIASLIQAEAQEDEEFGQVAQVIYNRLELPMMLQFDSTINYALNRDTLEVSYEDTELDSPYNTYQVDGLPPGPIDNPGHQALEAALNPTEGDWLYFVTVRPGDTRFTADHDEHEQNVRDFNAAQAEEGEG
ncbi:endolytic transglycosylase MltG [Streptomyces sp. PT12]|uniref:endolytic transglycosylase MltG n=1 Tax=Streptomyces sp. PT12 TaxID=1510197 RepID=UPI000DE4E26B|nr:endolytic transglycosylase MltG [Streptomyces sp. PT12]RBM24001.1 endolytic transglycosylase MltG [Streptomyces sp. PT12]